MPGHIFQCQITYRFTQPVTYHILEIAISIRLTYFTFPMSQQFKYSVSVSTIRSTEITISIQSHICQFQYTPAYFNFIES